MENAKVDTSNPAYRHGHSGGEKASPTYQSWACMVQRATNDKIVHAEHYVGRGITMDPQWRVFDNFLRDMGERPAGTTLDREDNALGYCKENCRWATRKEQSNNTRANRMVTIDGRTQSVTMWCEELGLNKNTVWSRIYKWKYSPEDAIKKPKQDRAESAREMTAKRCERVKD